MYQLFILVLQPLRRELMKDHKTQITIGVLPGPMTISKVLDFSQGLHVRDGKKKP